MNTRLALFDFDGTLIRGDSLFSFLRFAVPGPRFFLHMGGMLPRMAVARLGFMDRSITKEQLLARFFTGWRQEALAEAGAEYARTVFPGQLRQGARERVTHYLDNGFRVFVVTASLEEWVLPCAEALGAECVGTRLAYEGGVCTGRFATPNCTGEEKVRRIAALVDPRMAAVIHAYGDTESDRPMLALAHKAFYKPDYTVPLTGKNTPAASLRST